MVVQPVRTSAGSSPGGEGRGDVPSLRDAGRRREFDEAVVEAERRRAWDEGYAAGLAAGLAARRRLRVLR